LLRGQDGAGGRCSTIDGRSTHFVDRTDRRAVAGHAGAYGNWDAVYKQFERWTKGGLEAVAESDPAAASLQMIDATVVRVDHRASGGKGGFRPKCSVDRALASHRKSTSGSTRKPVRSTS